MDSAMISMGHIYLCGMLKFVSKIFLMVCAIKSSKRVSVDAGFNVQYKQTTK